MSASCPHLYLPAAQENFLQTVASDWRYERALQGIKLLAQHHVGQLVHAIIAWRQAVNDDIKKNYSTNNVVNMQGICKRVSTSHASHSSWNLQATVVSPSRTSASPPPTPPTPAVHQQHQQEQQDNCSRSSSSTVALAAVPLQMLAVYRRAHTNRQLHVLNPSPVCSQQLHRIAKHGCTPLALVAAVHIQQQSMAPSGQAWQYSHILTHTQSLRPRSTQQQSRVPPPLLV